MTILRMERHLREFITVLRISGHTSGGDPVRATSLVLAARVERQVVDQPVATGRDSAGSTVIFTVEALQVGDLVFLAEDNPADTDTGRLVTDVEKAVALDGTTTHWRALA